MANQKEDTTNYVGTLFFMVLFFLLTASLFGKSADQNSFSSQYQLKSDFSLNRAKADVPEAIQMPSIRSSCLQILNNTRITQFSEIRKIAADNHKIAQRLIGLQKNELLIKPLLQSRWFCFHPVPNDNEELPILG